ncbi:MAG: hypothetical protein Kow00129_03850 [Thermoleophilia bacterium]
MDEMLLELTGTTRLFGCGTCGFRPNVDVYYIKSDNQMIVKLELAGIDPADVELQVHDHVLHIRGNRYDRGDKDKVYQQMEIGYGTFERQIRLPLEVSVDEATAAYKDGFLLITLPVAESEPRRIAIKRGPESAESGMGSK